MSKIVAVKCVEIQGDLWLQYWVSRGKNRKMVHAVLYDPTAPVDLENEARIAEDAAKNLASS